MRRVARHRRRPASPPSRARRAAAPAPATTTAATTRSARSSTTPFSVIPGEDVKIAGVKVGKIESLDVTPDNKAAVVLDITEPGFKDFRRDADVHDPPAVADRREVRRVHADPAARRRARRRRRRCGKIDQGGRARASTCCRSRNTRSPVDLDLINNIMRLPYRQRLSIILNELGTGLAGRGDDLASVIRRANPALQRDRPGPGDPRRARTRCWPNLAARLRHGRSRRWRATARRSPTSSSRRTRRRRRRPSAAATSRQNFQLLPELPAPAARRRCSSLGGLRRPGDAGARPTSAPQAPDDQPPHQAARAVLAGRATRRSRSLGDGARRRRARRSSRRKPIIKRPRRVRAGRPSRCRTNLDDAAASLQATPAASSG